MKHRKIIGGRFEELGNLQKDFLIDKGLKPNHVLYDIGCGSLRLGRKIIPYLDKDNYIGIEKNKKVLKAGMNKELSDSIQEEKNPQFIIDEDFNFEKIDKKPDFVIVQSVFTHLPKEKINQCFKNLMNKIKPDKSCTFYATYFIEDDKSNIDNPYESEYAPNYKYTKEQTIRFGVSNGFVVNYIGN